MRVFCHAQHLSGVGHYVRMRAIAVGLRAAHEVYFVEGGRPVASAPDAHAPEAVRLTPIGHVGGKLVALASTDSVEAVLAARAAELTRAVEQIRPDVLLVEHYPFSKWRLADEIDAAIAAARRSNAAVRVLGSVRDVLRQTRYEPADRRSYEERVLSRLADFDGLLIHADPAFTCLEDHFGRAADLPVPAVYTGFVVGAAGEKSSPPPAGPYAVLSCGGGTGSTAFLLAAMEAFLLAGRRKPRPGAARGLRGQFVESEMRLVVFPGAFSVAADLAAIEAAAAGEPFQVRRFGPEFAEVLAASALSISHAGYNTCAALLRARVPSVLVPDPSMSDQVWRARRMAELGLSTTVEGNPPPVEALAAAMCTALASPPPRHDLSLDGVARTAALVETAAAWTGKK